MKLAVAARDGALQEWMSAYASELRAHLRRFVDGDDAEDLLQQVWIAAHRHPPCEGASSNVRAWLYRVATNAALDRIERERRRRTLLEKEGHRLRPEEASASKADSVPSAIRARVREAVARLPRKQREAVWLRWADGLPYEAVAARIGCSEQSARANVYQGMKRLRRDLSELLNEEAG